MQKLFKIGLLLGGFGLLWNCLLQGAKGLVIKVYSYTFQSVNVIDKTINLNLNLLIRNPLFAGLTINSIAGEVYAQGHQVGYVDQNLNYYIAGRRTHIIPLTVTLHLEDLTQAAWLNIQSGDIRTLTVSFNGKVYVGSSNIGVPLQFDLNYDQLV